MIIAADTNIPLIERACADLGELRCFDIRKPDELRQALHNADVLLCRSTIQVNPVTLADSKVRFVATATSGVDHIDIEALESCGVTVASAAGSNARSVADWLVAGLLQLDTDCDLCLEGASIGIVGVGHVGTAVYHAARALGLAPVLNDPPRESRGETPIPGERITFSTLEDTQTCDILTLHVPLTRSGDFPTFRMMNSDAFARLGDDTIFINTARGDVMAGDACLSYADDMNVVMLDVYPGEPDIDIGLLHAADLATAHIAGHSYDAKLRGTQMVYDAMMQWLGRSPRWRYEEYLPEPQVIEVRPHRSDSPYMEVQQILSRAYDITTDCSALYSMRLFPKEKRAAYFERLRADYHIRREFQSMTVKCRQLSPEALALLEGLGFRLQT
jgi:erythronate-4-phosphate dehydrogenase